MLHWSEIYVLFLMPSGIILSERWNIKLISLRWFIESRHGSAHSVCYGQIVDMVKVPSLWHLLIGFDLWVMFYLAAGEESEDHESMPLAHGAGQIIYQPQLVVYSWVLIFNLISEMFLIYTSPICLFSISIISSLLILFRF